MIHESSERTYRCTSLLLDWNSYRKRARIQLVLEIVQAFPKRSRSYRWNCSGNGPVADRRSWPMLAKADLDALSLSHQVRFIDSIKLIFKDLGSDNVTPCLDRFHYIEVCSSSIPDNLASKWRPADYALACDSEHKFNRLSH